VQKNIKAKNVRGMEFGKGHRTIGVKKIVFSCNCENNAPNSDTIEEEVDYGAIDAPTKTVPWYDHDEKAEKHGTKVEHAV
jgi:hypothetical protein